MKNFSTVGARFVIAALFAGACAAGAQAATCEFLPNAPDQHLVVKGDTLWDIAGAFLEHPWCWGQVWGMNRDEIRNPHWIYPGQMVYFNRKTGRLSLLPPDSGDDGAAGLPGTRLSPQLRTLGLDRDAVPSVSMAAISALLSQPLIVEADELGSAPRIIAAPEDHMFLGSGDKAYVRGALKDSKAFQVFRPGEPLKDPVSRKLLGYEAVYLGTANLKVAPAAGSDVATIAIVNAAQEMGTGDRLLPVPPAQLTNYAPHAPQQAVDAHVASIYGGMSVAGQSQIVTINRGTLDGLDVGAVLRLYHTGKTVTDTTAKTRWFKGQPEVKLPDEQYGDLFIFRVFKHVSYGLITQVSEPVAVGDAAKSPE
ncbi:MAG TPA: LysM peptidoglycan-binding domain-containing protein [Janthinobacterium sp.]|nr:LysM peptidoglycan-binding domain-containing protein [Janthinobacterium sp.]